MYISFIVRAGCALFTLLTNNDNPEIRVLQPLGLTSQINVMIILLLLALMSSCFDAYQFLSLSCSLSHVVTNFSAPSDFKQIGGLNLGCSPCCFHHRQTGVQTVYEHTRC